ncbi:MAG: lipase family protein [Halioglobus sp.]
MPHIRYLTIVLAAIVFAPSAVANNVQPVPVAPEDYGDFYDVSEVPAGSPGDLLKFQEITPFAPNSRAWRILYLSTSAQGEPVVVSGLVGVPAGEAPAQGFDIVSWAHGTKGVNDRCAPSRGYRVSHNFYAIAPEILDEGWIAVGTDYEGLGTAGVHPYLISSSEAYNQVDSIRAVAQLPTVKVSNAVVGWGRSQGGHATLALAEEVNAYAPEMDLRGVISAAPVGDMSYVYFGSAFKGASFNWLVAAGLRAAWDIDLAPYYDEDALAEMDALIAASEACYPEFDVAVKARDGVGMRWSLLWRWGDLTKMQELLVLSSVGDDRINVPVLVSQGTDDKIVPQSMTDALVEQMCAAGSQVEYQVHEGESHNDSSFLHMATFRKWTRQRFLGQPARGCQD